jgi:hypothetical protein
MVGRKPTYSFLISEAHCSTKLSSQSASQKCKDHQALPKARRIAGGIHCKKRTSASIVAVKSPLIENLKIEYNKNARLPHLVNQGNTIDSKWDVIAQQSTSTLQPKHQRIELRECEEKSDDRSTLKDFTQSLTNSLTSSGIADDLLGILLSCEQGLDSSLIIHRLWNLPLCFCRGAPPFVEIQRPVEDGETGPQCGRGEMMCKRGGCRRSRSGVQSRVWRFRAFRDDCVAEVTSREGLFIYT